MISLGDVEAELIGLDEHVFVEGVVDNLGELIVELLSMWMWLDFDPFLVHQRVAVLHIGEGLLFEGLAVDDVDGKDVNLFPLYSLVHVNHVLACLLVFHQESAQLAET